MAYDTKTVGGRLLPNSDDDFDPIDSLKREAIDRMKASLLAASLDDPLSAATAIQQVTVMRIYHQVSRIVQYIDIMDKLEAKLYKSIEIQLDSLDYSDDYAFGTITKLLAIQEKLQKSVIESNKLLAPYLDMEQYPAFAAIDAPTPVSAKILEVPATQRNLLRENASAILNELSSLPESVNISE